MRISSALRLFAICMLLLSRVDFALIASGEFDVELAAQATYALQVDSIAGITTSSYSYVLEVDNRGESPKTLWIRLTLRDVIPSSLRLVAGELNIARMLDLGKYVEVLVQLTAPLGKTSWELSGTPSSFPVDVEQGLTVNNEEPNVTSVGEYKFLSADVGDVLRWRIRLRNQLWGPGQQSFSPPVPITFIVNLDRKYFDLKELNPSPNSTTTEGANYWTFFLKGETAVEVEAEVSRLSEWGVATLAPFIVSYSSDQIPAMLQRMEARLRSLESTASFLEHMWSAGNSTAALLTDVSKYLGEISTGVAATGNGSLVIGEALLAISSNVASMGRNLMNYSQLVRSFASLATEQNLNRAIANLRSNLSVTISSLEETKSSIVSQQQLLLSLNETLTQLLETTTDSEQVALLTQAISTISELYETNDRLLENTDATLQSLRMMERTLAGIDVQLVAEQASSFASAYEALARGLSSLSAALASLGNASLVIGGANLNQSALLQLMSEEIGSGLNETRGQLEDMWSIVTEMKASEEELRKDIAALSEEKSRIELTSPEVIAETALIFFEVTAQNDTDLFDVLPHKEGSFIKYVSFDTNSDNSVLVQLENGSWREVLDLGALGAWHFGNLRILPIFSRADVNQSLMLGGRTPIRIVIQGGTTVRVYNGSGTSSLTEQVSGSMFQPDVARKIGLKPGGEQPTGPEAPPEYAGIEILIVGLGLLLLFIVVMNAMARTRTRAEREDRLRELTSGSRSAEGKTQ